MIIYIMDEETVIDEFYVSPNGSLAVSYTHLTLPTTIRV